MKPTHPIQLAPPPDWQQICNRMEPKPRIPFREWCVSLGLAALTVAWNSCAVYGAWMLFCKLRGWL